MLINTNLPLTLYDRGSAINPVAELLGHGAEETVAIWDETGSTSYGALKDAVARMAAYYRYKGYQPEERIILLLPDSVAWVICYLGAIWAGLVPMGVNPCSEEKALQNICDMASPRLVIGQALSEKLLHYVKAAYPEIDTWHISSSDKLLTQLNGYSAIAAHPFGPDDDMFWVFTSGTTGAPKGVVHGVNAMRSSVQFARDILGVGPGDILYATSRLFFAYPLANVLFAALGSGASMVVHQAWPTVEHVMHALAKYRPTLFFSVPSFYRQLSLTAGVGRLFHRIHYCISAGEHFSSALARVWKAVSDTPVINGYGMSETLSFILYGQVEVQSGLQAAPGVTLYSAHQAPANLCFTHPGLYKRYATTTEHIVRSGVYQSQDVFTEVAPQQFMFQGRSDYLFKIKGRFIHPIEEETILLTACAEELKDAAVICEPDAMGVLQLVWCLVTMPLANRTAMEARLQQLIRQLPAYRQPSVIRYYEVLPRNASGKLLHRFLIDQQDAECDRKEG